MSDKDKCQSSEWVDEESIRWARKEVALARISGRHIVKCSNGHIWITETWTDGMQNSISLRHCYCGETFSFRGKLIGTVE